MFKSSEVLDKKIKKEFGWLLEELVEAGWIVVRSQYSAKVFGNWLVDFSRGEKSLRLIKDRGQYSVDDGSNFAERQTAGIDGVFDSWEEFASIVYKNWVLKKG